MKNVRMLQLIQIAVAWTVLEAPKVAHVTLLHSLLICCQVQLQVLVVTFKAFYDKDPGYLQNHLYHNGIGPYNLCW